MKSSEIPGDTRDACLEVDVSLGLSKVRTYPVLRGYRMADKVEVMVKGILEMTAGRGRASQNRGLRQYVCLKEGKGCDGMVPGGSIGLRIA